MDTQAVVVRSWLAWLAQPDCGVIVLGDFNILVPNDILNYHNLKQVVRDPTRLDNILDLILTYMYKHYDKPVVSVILGTSDHSSVYWRPKTSRTIRVNKTQKHSVRRFRSRPSTPSGDGSQVINGSQALTARLPSTA